METALGALPALGPEGARRLWMVVDDLEALHRLPSLLPALGEACGFAPSASAVRTLAAESGIGTETLRRFLARNAGVSSQPFHDVKVGPSHRLPCRVHPIGCSSLKKAMGS